MTDENQGNLGTDIIRFHRIITRGLEITIQNVNRFLEIGALKEEKREGFIKYVQSFSTVLDAHHIHENEKIFPYFKDKLPDAPYDQLMAQHKGINVLLTQINGGINNLKSNVDELKSLDLLKTSLEKIDRIWQIHMKTEEEKIFERVGSLNISLEETNRLRAEFSEFFGEHAKPAYLIVPFMLYNLSPKDRVVIAQGFPEIITKQLVNADWKDEWAPMQPFLII
ncbi:hemerythrin domain-containing protein [Methanobacterium oryzae]|uniref:hemerythrin domain-containing protein n=1 Tax=Methanobacterium oryzae TaxID=69540 RepID=UPI003D1D8AFA